MNKPSTDHFQVSENTLYDTVTIEIDILTQNKYLCCNDPGSKKTKRASDQILKGVLEGRDLYRLFLECCTPKQ